MENFMNVPENYQWTEIDIITAYRYNYDIKEVANQFCITQKEVKAILRQARIPIRKLQPKSDGKLADIGMSEKDFYKDNI